MLRKITRREHGQDLVIFALALPVLLAMLALVVDGGFAYAQRRRMQTAADAAALAGGRVIGLAQGSAQVAAAVNQYAFNNSAASASWQYINGGNGIRVNTQRTFNTFFAGLAGVPTMTAAATADVSLSYLCETGNLLPIIVYDWDFEYGQEYEIWDTAVDAPGSFGWVDWHNSGGGNDELTLDILDPSRSGTVRVGDDVTSRTGIGQSDQVMAALESWIDREVLIPLWDTVGLQGTNTVYNISAFAVFYMTDARKQGNDKVVTGRFVRKVFLNAPGGCTHGARTMRLTN
ncbi:MAG: pilus assembly protein [Anaerolineae bacterium]|nr:pilus assembly protein [Anaerolineae bacterium]